MELYQIIKSLQEAQGSIAKQDILDANKDNELLKNYMKAVLDPAISYYVTKMPKVASSNMATMDQELIDWVIKTLAERKLTGKEAEKALKQVTASLDEEGQELLELLIKRKIGASVGDTMVLKTWPDLYFLPPYMRCSLMDEKIKNKFEALDEFFVQPKLDGSFLYLVVGPDKNPEAITRAGSKYPTWFAERLADGLEKLEWGTVFVGEVEVFNVDQRHDGLLNTLLPRQEGNGLLNAVLKGRDEDEFNDYSFRLTAWDILDEDEFKEGLSMTPYKGRLADLQNTLDTMDTHGVGVIETHTVKSMEEAFKIYNGFTSCGMEGAVVKNPKSIWKDGTSKDNVKLKIAFEADYIVTGMTEGTGKAEGMMGSLSIATSDGLLTSDVGTGFDDVTRKAMWSNPNTVIGSIVTVIANDVISKRTDNVKSLFLPVYSDTRFDKTEADSLPRVMEQLEAARQGG